MIDFHCHITTPGSRLPTSEGEYYQTFETIASSGVWMNYVWAETIETVAEYWRDAAALRGYRQMSPLIYSEMVRRMLQTSAARLTREMAHNGVRQAVAVAIDPYIPTDEVVEACLVTKGIILPFGSVDPWAEDWEGALERTLARPIAGFKFHHNLQRLPFNHPRMRDILNVMARRSFEKPIFVHSGDYPIYAPIEGDWVADLGVVLAEFSALRFVCGHCGWNRPAAACRLARKNSNLWLETSWQPPGILRRLCDLLGPSRFVIGSDFPLYSMRRAISNCRSAFTPQEFEIVSESTPRMLLGASSGPESSAAYA